MKDLYQQKVRKIVFLVLVNKSHRSPKDLWFVDEMLQKRRQLWSDGGEEMNENQESVPKTSQPSDKTSAAQSWM